MPETLFRPFSDHRFLDFFYSRGFLLWEESIAFVACWGGPLGIGLPRHIHLCVLFIAFPFFFCHDLYIMMVRLFKTQA